MTFPDAQTYDLSGLQAPASIHVDQWGIAHIRAGGRRDLFFVQGFNAARDRLWQLDIWRKRGLGLLSADFGPGFVEQDRAARLFLYRGDMDAEWASYGVADARQVTEAFVAGINAFIALTAEQPELTPPEFGVTGTQPALWAADDVVRIRTHALVANIGSEVARAEILEAGAPAADALRRNLEPPRTPAKADGLDLAGINARVLETLRLATVPFYLTDARLAASPEDAGNWRLVDDLGVVSAAEGEGSNNWAVSPSRTATSRPILASDPHRSFTQPSLRYVVHLKAPGLDVIGAGEPAMPGVALGHNESAAFGLTMAPLDQEDLYLYAMSGNDYAYGVGREPLTVIEEMIPVRGGYTMPVRLEYTRHGPVIWREGNRAAAVRSVWLEPGSSAYFASLGYLGTTSVGDFRTALSHWSVPCTNHVYADVSGTVAWQVAGKVPVRPNWDGLLPAPGDGTHEWAGFHPAAVLPGETNPNRGFVSSANEMNLPSGAETLGLGFEWSEPSRANRIRAVLSEQSSHSVADAMALQTDDLSIPAKRVCALLPARASALLQGWDHHLGAESAAAALFEVWWTLHLRPALLRTLVPDAAVRLAVKAGDAASLLRALETDMPVAERDTLMLETLHAAHADCVARMGPDSASWSWGQLHHTHFEHPLTAVFPTMAANVGPYGVGGSGSTPMAMHYRGDTFQVTVGAQVRLVMDVGDWDKSMVINGPGQSGDPRSPHYADHGLLWAEGKFVPLLFSDAAVDAATRQIITLKPKR
ncbi:penicillin amidase [Devosia sp. YR412]|uniref:penicillin acylase family protein n=1 Tax=Devosia sp. YR412 TaxID=1881030 RepID=UPI0008B4BD6E|nr:penicillin acylase family protein [Devosia sp. YR412]SEQ41056.1 penicillin amidase [Devosia sp. YR412]